MEGFVCSPLSPAIAFILGFLCIISIGIQLREEIEEEDED